MGFRILCEHRAEGVDRDGLDRHTGQIATAGDERGDRVKVLAVGLDGVRRGLPRAAIGEKGGEPLRSRRFDAVSLLGAVGHAAWITTLIHQSSRKMLGDSMIVSSSIG